jgi:hypothetical protein
MAKVEGISPSRLIVNRQSLQILHCSYNEGGKTHTFRSDALSYVPVDLANKTVRVWVNRNNYNDYYVDTNEFFDAGGRK